MFISLESNNTMVFPTTKGPIEEQRMKKKMPGRHSQISTRMLMSPRGLANSWKLAGNTCGGGGGWTRKPRIPGGSDFCWSNPQGIPAAPPLGKNIDKCIRVTHFKPATFAE